jgi:hypothetical protein
LLKQAIRASCSDITISKILVKGFNLLAAIWYVYFSST